MIFKIKYNGAKKYLAIAGITFGFSISHINAMDDSEINGAELPQEVCHHVLENFNEREDFSSFALTCRNWLNSFVEFKNTHPKKIIVIGPAGSGKSTLAYIMMGKELVAEENPFYINRCSLQTAEPIAGIDIVSGGTFGTLKLAQVFDPIFNRTIVDCPGFFNLSNCDTESDEKQIVENALDLHEVLKQGNLKVIVCVTESTFDAYGQYFNLLMNKITEMFPNQSELKRLVHFVMMGRGEKQNLRSVRNTYQSAQTKELLSFVEENKDRLVLFPYVCAAGKYTPPESLVNFLNSEKGFCFYPRVAEPQKEALLGTQGRWSSEMGYDEYGNPSKYYS